MINIPNIAVYGGAFTPPTIGHRAIVEALLRTDYVDRVIITPSGPRGDKEYAFQKDIRRRLIEIFASEFDDDRVEVDFTFLDSSSETTTLGMDHHYQDRFGESPFQVFGADVSRAMASWPYVREQKEYLLMRLPKIFLSRPGSDLDLEDKGNYHIIDAPIPESSSTAVREQGRVDLLTDGVREAYLKLITENKT